jgi:chitinase
LILRKFVKKFLGEFFFLLLIIGCFNSTIARFKVVGYYPDWLKTTLLPGKIEFENVDYIIHAFAWPDSDGTINMYSGLLYPQLNSAVHNSNKKILLSFGGWGQSGGFATMCADSATRAKFINNIVNFLIENNYDGIDLDWESPSDQQQKTNFTLLIKEMRQKFNEVNPQLLITMAAPAGDWGGQWIEYEKIQNYLDWIAVMTYDFHGSWSSYTGPNAPLYLSPDDKDNAGSVYNAIKYMTVTRKIPIDKIILGMPFYGKEFNSSGMYKTFSGDVADRIYSEIISITSTGGWIYNWDDVSKVPYYQNSDSTKLITYDDTTSIKYKVEFSYSRGLAGVMIWALGQDLVNGSQPLLETVGNTVRKVTSVNLADNQPLNGFCLYNNYPNPFNPVTTIEFHVSAEAFTEAETSDYSQGISGFVTLKVYDITGREVTTLVNEEKHAGDYKVRFDSEKYHLSSGVYFYTLSSGRFREAKEMLLLK